ncbi:MAG: hypothetical protein II800_04230, partial [Lachnospiraceae bacterium]|nr:hypothetical protein [Lachnospiraceae bacterium]
VNAGAAKSMIAAHNEKRSERKKVSLTELSDRTGRTEKQQREHHHSARDKVKEAEEVKKQ